MMKKSVSKLASLIIVNYNGKEDTLEFLESIKKTEYPEYEIIVVDNGSTDGSVKAIKKHFPYAKIVENKKNLGASGGKNSGIKVAKGNYIIVLDNDMYVQDSNWLTGLVKAAESDKKIGIVSPMLMSYKRPDIIQRSGSDVLKGIPKLLTDIFGPSFFYMRSKGMNVKDVGQYTKIEDIKDSGAGLIKREVIDSIGGFDEKLFCYFEDSDFSFRAKKAGFRVVRAPKAKLLHKGASTMKHGEFAFYHSYKNKLRFILKNYGFFTRTTAAIFNLVYYLILIVFYTLKRKYSLSKAIIDGIAWNIKNWRDYI